MTSSDFNIPATAAPSGQLASAAAAASPADLHVASSQADIDAALADPSLAALLGHGAPVIVASGAPAHILFASASACALFGTRDPDLLRSRVFGGRDPASQRLAVLVASLVPSAAPRLERLRFFFGTSAETLTIVCRSVLSPSGGHVVAFAATGVRAALMRPLPALAAAVAEHATPEPVPAEPALVPHVQHAEAAVAATGADAFLQSEHTSRDDNTGIGLAIPVHVAAAPPLPATVHAAAPAHPPVTGQSPAPVDAVGHTQPVAAGAAPAICPADPVRFAWRSDARLRVTDISDAFLQAFGLLRAQICGHSWQELATTFGFDPDGSLYAALQRRASWSGLDFSWPLQAEGGTVPISLGGAPVFDAAAVLTGIAALASSASTSARRHLWRKHLPQRQCSRTRRHRPWPQWRQLSLSRRATMRPRRGKLSTCQTSTQWR